MTVIWTKYPGRAVVGIDIEKLDGCFGKVEENADGVRRQAYTATKLKKLFKSLEGFDCDHTKEEILQMIKKPKHKEVWAKYYEQA